MLKAEDEAQCLERVSKSWVTVEKLYGASSRQLRRICIKTGRSDEGLLAGHSQSVL
ncbi:hypothetical protein EYR41_002410 [Orbilia oligospora]|uniref:Uncharacterized protein n=1 Tax=Orbilia oligospora TaxID=2813651 RepID=A0A8H2HIC8_ORBOL|nr:hypothetical protein EYR41_002410 [Orbilia oligospora]